MSALQEPLLPKEEKGGEVDNNNSDDGNSSHHGLIVEDDNNNNNNDDVGGLLLDDDISPTTEKNANNNNNDDDPLEISAHTENTNTSSSSSSSLSRSDYYNDAFERFIERFIEEITSVYTTVLHIQQHQLWLRKEGEDGNNNDNDMELKFIYHFFVTLLLWFATTILAIAAPDLGFVLDLVGCCTGTLIAFILPALLSFRLDDHLTCNVDAALLLALGVTVGTMGTLMSFI